jgi:hypothetical protein
MHCTTGSKYYKDGFPLNKSKKHMSLLKGSIYPWNSQDAASKVLTATYSWIVEAFLSLFIIVV